MTRDAVLTAWLEGARIGTLARIVNEDPVGVEDALRHELRSIREEYQPSVSADPAPLPTARKAQAADSSPSPEPQFLPARKRPTYRNQAKPVHTAELDVQTQFADYPPELRDARAIRMRAVYDALRESPADFAEIEAELERRGFDGDLGRFTSNGVYALRERGLVIPPEVAGGKWRLAE